MRLDLNVWVWRHSYTLGLVRIGSLCTSESRCIGVRSRLAASLGKGEHRSTKLVVVIDSIGVHAFLKLKFIHSNLVRLLLLKRLKSVLIFATAQVLLNLFLAHAPKGRSTGYLCDIISGTVILRNVITHIHQRWGICALLFTWITHAFVVAERITAVGVTGFGITRGHRRMASLQIKQRGRCVRIADPWTSIP